MKKLSISPKLYPRKYKINKLILVNIFKAIIILIGIGLVVYIVITSINYRKEMVEVCMKNTGHSREYCSYLAR